MGLWGDVENATGDVVHVGEHVADDVAGMLDSLRSFLADAGLGNVVQELKQLAEQANQAKQRLASAMGAVRWTGAAANGFQHRAQQRQQQMAELVAVLDSALDAVATAYTVAGVL
jgi:uncharacterized protein YukE